MILPLGLWLCCIGFTSQQHCSSPGSLPAPQLFLDTVSSHPGDTVLLKCKVPALSRFTYVIFCKDGQDLTVQPMMESRFAYNLHHKVSTNSSGNFACLYQHIDGQMKNSFLSAAWYLNVTANILQANNSSPGMQPSCEEMVLWLILGSTIPSGLFVILVCFLLMKKGLSKCRHTRIQDHSHKSRSTEDKPDSASPTGYFQEKAPQGNKDIDGSYESLNAITMEDTPYSTLPVIDAPASTTSECQPNVPFYEEAGDFATQMSRCSSSDSDGYEGEPVRS
ncbi:hypothetical protein KIL84_002029 [Mauremys mutica]|uniref:Ig-like domain-containing protein n=1 Tax=Mauremys mutica TaxID=74926 RepID=A0A9D4B5J7_9SAUR|nr:hypothetical protein KIL84_002029 [Mauremys mutica]